MSQSSSSRKDQLRALFRCIPPLIRFQIVTKLLMAAILYVLNQLALLILRRTGRVALTSGDADWLFQTWEGWVILIGGAFTIIIMFCIDINAKIIYSDSLLQGKPLKIRNALLKGAASMRRFLNPIGILAIAYLSFAVPIIGIGFTSSLTSGFMIPPWIFEGFVGTFWWPIAKNGVLILLLYLGMRFSFLFHGVVLGKKKPAAAAKQSSAILHAHWKEFLVQYFAGTVIGLPLLNVCLYNAMTSLSFLLIDHSGAGLSATRFFNIFTCCLAAILFWFLTLLVTPCQIQVLTGLYSRWTARQSEPELPRAGRGFRIAAILCVIAALAVSSLTGLAGIYDFNDMFPDEISVKIVAHRLGGNLGPENTLAGMKAAEEQGTWGCEMDVQRTKDGYYIINHDDNFQRVAGDRRKSTEMTLAEIQQLRVKNRFDPRRPSAQVSTLEEVLDEAKEKGTFLFVELKGETADQKMADDVTAMIREKGMVDQCLIMSLKYPVISYEETTYPEMFTGYIYSYSYGDSADLNCDAMILEVSAATDDEVDKIHQYGKKVYVWTVDTHSRLKHFLSSSVDAIITNEVVQAEAVSASLDSRSERRRVTDFFGTGINNYFRGLLNASDAASN